MKNTNPRKLMRRVVLGLAILVTLYALYLLATPAGAQDCSYRTGASATMVFYGTTNVEASDVVTVRDVAGVSCYGRTTVPEGNFALAVWEDNPVTPTKDGASPYELLAVHVERDGYEPFQPAVLGTFERDGVAFVTALGADSLDAAIQRMEGVIDSLRTEVRSREQTIVQKDQAISNLRANLAALTTESAQTISAYQDSLATARQTIQDLRDQIGDSPTEQEIQARIDAAVADAREDERNLAAARIERAIRQLLEPGQ